MEKKINSFLDSTMPKPTYEDIPPVVLGIFGSITAGYLFAMAENSLTAEGIILSTIGIGLFFFSLSYIGHFEFSRTDTSLKRANYIFLAGLSGLFIAFWAFYETHTENIPLTDLWGHITPAHPIVMGVTVFTIAVATVLWREIFGGTYGSSN